MTDQSPVETPEQTSVTPLLAPAGGTPKLITTASQFEEAFTKLESGSGPFAVDAERASGYRYSARAYLIQIKRENGGLHLIDPLTLSSQDCGRLNDLLQSDEVILHASTQDLPCLRELGISPRTLFDTELGARIAGYPRVGLGSLVETILGLSLAKEHSAVDWSQRPLPIEWLTYAALDVELLIPIRDAIAENLRSQNKLEWALQDFAAILTAPASPARTDPWRRTSGMHKVKKREELAIVRELWIRRAHEAEAADIAQGRLLSDLAIVELALTPPSTKKEFEKVLRPLGYRARWGERVQIWLDAINDARALPSTQLPELRMKSDGIPPAKIWKEKYPEKYAPLTHARKALADISRERSIPVENTISPEIVRKICWNQPSDLEAAMAALGARPWQIDLVAPALAHALTQKEPLLEAVSKETGITQQ